MILIAEDEPRLGAQLEDMLSVAGFGALHVATPGEAIATITHDGSQLSALITDIQLGNEIDGWDIARCAREFQPNLPILYISGTCAAEHRSRGVPDSLMLRKPVVPNQILRALENLLDR